LKRTQEKLTAEIERLQKETKHLRANALDMYKRKNEEAAKASLRRSRVLGKSLEEKEAALNTIELQLEELRSSKTNRMIVTSFSAGATALKEELNDSKLSPDEISKVMDDIHEVLSDHHDVNTALSS
jgi:phage shock protein A